MGTEVTARDEQSESAGPTAAEEPFTAIVQALSAHAGVALGSGRGFGAGALCVGGRIFAIPRSDGLVLKLPGKRVAQLLASGDGAPFDAGKGKPMKEWVVLGLPMEKQWLRLATEALAFVAAGSARTSSA